jgi:hypothetical protein
MPYHRSVYVFVEAPLFSKLVYDYLTDDGKSGGVRVLYYLRTTQGEIWLLAIYAKSARDSMEPHVLKALKEEMEDAAK